MSKVPKKVKVAPFVFEVSNEPALLAQLAGDASLNFSAQQIAIDTGQAASYLKDSLLHELLHAVWQQSALNDPSEKGRDYEERVIATLTPRILALLRDNPALVRWLIEVDESEYSGGKKRKTSPRKENADGVQEG